MSGGLLHVRDLGSTNGSRANGVGLAEGTLRGGETLALGDTQLTVHRGEDDGEPLVSDEVAFGRYLGRSVAMRRLYPLCERLAAARVPVVIEGETGTGKELLAEVLSSACVQGIQAPYGTQAWRDALQACIDEARASRPAAPPSEPTLDPRPAQGTSTGQSCSSSIQCINGACTCGAGPNKGASCDGRTPTGAESCSVKCRTCS